MNLSENFKKFMGMVEENYQELKKDLTPTPLPSGPEVWEEGKKNGKEMQEDILKNRGAEMATDLLPGGAAVGMIKKAAPEVINSIYPLMPGATVKATKYVQRNVRDVKELEHILDTGYMLPKEGGKMQKYFTATDEVNPVVPKGNTMLRIARDKVAPDKAVRAEDVEVFDFAAKVWKPLSNIKKEANDFFGMHKSTELGDVVLTKSAKDPSKFQMTLFDGKLGSSNTVKDMQFDTREEAMKAFEGQ